MYDMCYNTNHKGCGILLCFVVFSACFYRPILHTWSLCNCLSANERTLKSIGISSTWITQNWYCKCSKNKTTIYPKGHDANEDKSPHFTVSLDASTYICIFLKDEPTGQKDHICFRDRNGIWGDASCFTSQSTGRLVACICPSTPFTNMD